MSLKRNFLDSLVRLKDKLIKISEDDYDGKDEGLDLQDYGLSDEDLEGLQVMDDPYQDEDEADAWLREQEKTGSQEAPEASSTAQGGEEKESGKKGPKEKQKISSAGYTDWQPHGEYTPEQEDEMKKLMDDGYTHREAEFLAGAHKGPSDFNSALSHTVRPSQQSEKVYGMLKELAGPMLENFERHSKLNADPEKNPQKFASGQMLRAHEEHSKGFDQAYSNFLNSDEVKNLKGRARHKAIRNWKNQWHEENPEFKENVENVSAAGKHFKEAPEAAKRSLHERIQHIMTGGVGGEPTMSAAEAAQHVGGEKTEEGFRATTMKDPSATFAQQNPELVRILKEKASPEQFDRFHRVNSAKMSAPKEPKAPTIKVRKKGEGA